MSRPLSDAETTFMPELHPATQPAFVVALCGWCGIRLNAIPDAPREWNGRRYHPGGCVAAQRDQDGGVSTE